MYYFAIPPKVFLDSAAAIKASGVSETGWTRLIAEKPFGRDLKSAQELIESLKQHFTEDYIYRIDHYLGQEMVQNMFITRFGNVLFENIWNRNFIESVSFNFKEDFGTKGRGGYFDDYGVIRDVV
jgi:glucose-6-phosphate 1-dehydrogenase